MPLTLRDLLFSAVKTHASALFLSNTEMALTYQEVFNRAVKYARFLSNAHAQQGDRVLIVDTDPVQTTLWLLACCLLGIVFIVLHRDTSRKRMEYLLKDAAPVGVIDLRIASEDERQVYADIGFVITHETVIDGTTSGVDFQHIQIIETDSACFVYTSGSTGQPKGIICPHKSVISATTSINSYICHTENDRIGHILPLSFDYGLYQIFLAMQAGATLVFPGEFRSPLELVTQLRELRITGFPTLRSVLVPLVRLEKETRKMEHLRYLSNTGDALSPALIQKILTCFPHTRFFSMYGLSECKRALYMPPERLASKPLSVGQPIPGTRVFVVDENNRPLPVGKIGELVVEGPHVMNGYWNAPEETAKKFIKGTYGQPQLRTGDLFFQDSNGDFHFVARRSDLIKSRGFRISPQEVEAALLAADSLVRECIVYGVDDELLGQAIHADVKVDDPAHTVAEIFVCCQKSMDTHLIPTHIRIVENLARTASGKYMRHSTREA